MKMLFDNLFSPHGGRLCYSVRDIIMAHIVFFLLTTVCNMAAVSVKEKSFCTKILQRKGYYKAREKMMTEIDRPEKKRNYSVICKVVSKFSIDLFKDPEALLCAEPIRLFVWQKYENFTISARLCNIKPSILDEIQCISQIQDFDNCIQTNMVFTLKGLVLEEKPDKYACTKCREAPFVKNCSAVINEDHRCKKMYNSINSGNIGNTSCEICLNPNAFTPTAFTPTVKASKDVNGTKATTGVKQEGGYNNIIVGSLVGGILLILAAVVVITYIRRKRKNNKDADDKTRKTDDSDVKNSKSRSSHATKDEAGIESHSNRTETDITSGLAS